MTRIYFLFIALLAFASQTSAQTDMQLITYGWKNGDTVKWNTSGSYGMIIQWGFKNIGTTALVRATDTILMKRAYTVGAVSYTHLDVYKRQVCSCCLFSRLYQRHNACYCVVIYNTVCGSRLQPAAKQICIKVLNASGRKTMYYEDTAVLLSLIHIQMCIRDRY